MTTSAQAAVATRSARIMTLFAVIYAVQGLCDPNGIIGQPLMRYGKEELGWTPTLVSLYFSLFALPWMLKPLFGLLSDTVPIFGYRRKSYLIGANLLAAIAYAGATAMTAWPFLLYAFVTIFFAMAVSSTACGGLLVETGQSSKSSDLFVNQQWLWLSITSVASAALGGWFAENFSPRESLTVSSAVLLLAPLSAVFWVGNFLTERRSTFELRGVAQTLASIWSALKSGRLLAVGLFLFLYMFSPGFNVALYFHMTNELHFSQQFVGVLGSVSAAGSIAGALLHRYALRGLTMKAMVKAAIVLGSLSTLSYLFLSNGVSAIVLNFVSGAIGTITIIVAATLAADFSPARSEGFGFAVLAAVENIAIRLSDVSGSYLYDNVLSHRFAPLVVVSGATTALVLLFVPLLRLGSIRQGEAVSLTTQR